MAEQALSKRADLVVYYPGRVEVVELAPVVKAAHAGRVVQYARLIRGTVSAATHVQAVVAGYEIDPDLLDDLPRLGVAFVRLARG